MAAEARVCKAGKCVYGTCHFPSKGGLSLIMSLKTSWLLLPRANRNGVTGDRLDQCRGANGKTRVRGAASKTSEVFFT